MLIGQLCKQKHMYRQRCTVDCLVYDIAKCDAFTVVYVCYDLIDSQYSRSLCLAFHAITIELLDSGQKQGLT
jgi:hypothetical protein